MLLKPAESLWRISCNIPKCWRVSDDESRRVLSEGEGACSPFFRVRSHLPLRGKLGWMTPRVGVKTTPANGNAPLGALVPKQGPHFFARMTSIVEQPFLALHLTLPMSGIQLIDLLGCRNVQLMQHVENFCVAQSRGIILKR
jgi:hypothetical protein